MSAPKDVVELLESLDRHFLAGCGFLDSRQFTAHEMTGSCALSAVPAPGPAASVRSLTERVGAP